MFYYLDGTVAEILPYLAVIDCGGVGYACKTTNNTLAALKKGQRKRLYTYLNVAENIFELYGFATQSELKSFQLLIGVSGVGPKAALAVLSSGTPETLAMAIVTGDEKALTAAPGIGVRRGTGFFRRQGCARSGGVWEQGGGSRPGPGGAGLLQPGGLRGLERCGRGEIAFGGDHSSEPEKNGAVRHIYFIAAERRPSCAFF